LGGAEAEETGDEGLERCGTGGDDGYIDLQAGFIS